uniref:Uncharacterized protein n=1 Tax=Sinocyclocheilus rhinocerous TaxID=307959 RepID=A0A673L4P0_9TELE
MKKKKRITALTRPPELITTTLVNACVYSRCAMVRFRTGSPCCFAKDTRLRLLQLKIMASAVAAIYM